MGLAEGGITFRTYYVDGELPSNLRQEFLERIRARRFQPLTLESEEDVTWGWVPLQNPLSTDFRSPDLFFEPFLVLALRMDRWALPPLLLKASVRAAERAKLDAEDRAHLSRTERGELLERERARLKRQSLPAARVVDFAWNLDTRELRFSSLSRTVNETFAHHFELTFQLRLIADSPYMRAMSCGLEDALVGRLADVEPTNLLGASRGPR
jgi:recombination associated protein RdgC